MLIDQLELELRQLEGVSFVAFAERPETTCVEIGVEPGYDSDRLREQATRLALGVLDGEVTVEVVAVGGREPTARDERVQLVAVVPVPERPGVLVHLAHRGQRVAVEAAGVGRLAVAEAVVGGLGQLGFAVPYRPTAAHGLSDELGSGTLVVLEDPATGQVRRGIAAGRSTADATARSVLAALNRFLQPARGRRLH
ncbi:MAG TPA: hypothetical protein VKV25_10290 [Acidimicrobiales bacterium]|nr:hypothetical protein [Acidimicrobiales bacterium]